MPRPARRRAFTKSPRESWPPPPSRIPLFFSPPPPLRPLALPSTRIPSSQVPSCITQRRHDSGSDPQMPRENVCFSLSSPPPPPRSDRLLPPHRPLLPGPAPVTRATGAHTPALSALAQPCPTPSRPRHQSHSLTPHSGETHYRRISSAPGHSPRAPEEAHRVVVRLQRLQLRERRCRRRGLRGTLTSRAA